MLMSRRSVVRTAAASAALLAASRVGHAQSYPSRPIRLVVPFPPGGAFDAVGRPWAERIQPLLGTIVIENIGGGGSSLGAAAVVRAPADGYTILLGGTQTHVNEALIKAKPLYDPLKDLEPITGVAAYHLAIALHPSVPARSIAELVAHAKSGAAKLSYGHAGVGSIQHLTGELFKTVTAASDIVQVPYRGTGPAIADLISGHIPIAILGINGQLLELHQSGKIRILAVTAPSRLTAAPDLPTVTESGFKAMTVTGTIGLFAPAGTPKAAIERIGSATRNALAEPQFKKLLIDGGFEPASEFSPDALARTMAGDLALWTPVVKAIGMKVE